MRTETFRKVFGRNPGTVPYGRVTHRAPSTTLPQAALFHYWHPDRDGVELAPERIREAMRKIHPDLAIVRPPAGAPVASRAWCVWFRKPSITHALSPGWMLFFVWQEKAEEYIDGKGLLTIAKPLDLEDGRLIANIFRFSVFGDFKSAEAHFRNVCDTMAREKAVQRKADDDRRHDIAKDFWDSTKIKNIGTGSKFARHHDGSVVESRGDQNWRLARGTRDQPGDVTQRDARDRERRLDRRGR